MATNKKNNWSPPALAEVVSFYLSQDRTEHEARQFYLKQTAQNWMTGRYVQCRNWKALALSWIELDKKRDSPEIKYKRAPDPPAEEIAWVKEWYKAAKEAAKTRPTPKAGLGARIKEALRG